MKRFQKILSSTLAVTLALSCALPVSVSAAKTFWDVKNHWAADFINSGVNRGYVNGYENGSFNPNGSVTRAEFCKMINNALGLKNTVAIQFTDVSSGDWFYNDVVKAVASGYIAGYDDGSFRANDKISRQEAAVVISRIVSDAGTQKDLSALKDAGSIASWAMSGASSVFSKGYMGGDNQKRFNPTGNLTRGEAVKIVESILDGEKINSNDTYVSYENQTNANQVYAGNVTVSANGSNTLKNCRILGTLSVTGEGTVRLEDSKVGKLAINVGSGKAEVIASGNTDVRQTDLATGASLTENTIYGIGFDKVNFSGSKLSSHQVNLSGTFGDVNVDTTSNLNLRSGAIQNFRLSSNASGSKINLASWATIGRAELNGRGDFTGSGTIQYAILNNTGSTFETEPLRKEGKTSLVPTITPRNGATGVSVTDNIRLSFTDIPYTSSNTVVTSSYVEGSVLELRRDSESGNKMSFSVSLTNNNRDITIDPNDKLSSGTRYYVIVKPSLRNSRGDTNDRVVYNFTTQSGLIPTVYPADGASNIAVSTLLRLEFGESVYQPNRDSLSSSYLKDTALELRYGSKNGRTVSISPSISSDRRTITISTNGNLSTNTTYYLVLKSGTIANYNRDTFSEQVYSFTTSSSNTLVPAMTPSPGASGVSTGTDIVLDFDTTIYTSSGNTMTNSYLEDSVFSLRRDNAWGNTTSFRASMNSSRTSVTLTPSSSLRDNTTYYLVIADGSLSNGTSSNRRYNERIVLSFATGTGDMNGDLAPYPSPSNGSSGNSVDTNITLNFDTTIYKSGTYYGDLTRSYLENTVIDLRSDSASGNYVDFSADISSSNKTITIRPTRSLSTNTRYYVTVKSGTIQNSSGLKNSKFTSYFTCGSTGALLAPSISPEDGSSGISPSTDIRMSFNEDIYDTSGTRLSDNTTSCTYMTKYALSLRSGSDTGDLVPFSTTNIDNNRRVTIKPRDSLNSGTTYYLVLNDNVLRNSAGQSNKRQVFRFTVGSGLTVSTSPRNGDWGISRTAPIEFYFNDPIRDSNGYNITDSYVKRNLSVSPSFSYQADLINGGRTLRITPEYALQANQTYTLTLPSNSVMNSNGYRNSAVSVSFTTNTTGLVPTISPSDGSTNISPSSNITISFGETLYYPTYPIVLTDSDAQRAVELRLGGPSGSPVGATVRVTGNNTITLTPTDALAKGTKYCVVLKSGGMVNSSNVQNSPREVYFTTQAEPAMPAPTMTFGEIESTGSENVIINFASAIKWANGNAIYAEDLKTKLKLLKNGSTQVVPDSVQISNNQTITFTYNTPLTPSTNYTLSAEANLFSDASNNKNTLISVTKATPAPSVNVSHLKVEKDKASILVTYDYPVGFTFGVKTSTTGAKLPVLPEGTMIRDEQSGSFELPLSNLTEGSEYTVSVNYTYPGVSTPITKTTTFTTEKTSTDSTLSAFSIRYNNTTYTDIAIVPNGTKEIKVPSGTVEITPTAAAGDKAKIMVDGVVVDSGTSKSFDVNKSTVIINIVVKAEKLVTDPTADEVQYTTNYTLKLVPTP